MEEQSDTPRMSIKFSGELGMSLLNRIAQLERERDEARAEVEGLRSALRGLHDDIVEYQRINHLGGYDNHWMLAARAALAAAEPKP